MLKKNTNNWDNKTELDCLLFFAYLIDEMSFNYTIDTFKAPALNSKSLCFECLATIDNISSQIISKGAFKSIIEELAWSLDHDLVVKRIIPEINLKRYISRLSPSNSINEIKSIVQILLLNIDEVYFSEQKELLSELIKTNREKGKIEIVTRSFITELQNQGFSSEYIYYSNRDFFFSRSSINDTEKLNDYFSLFVKEKVEYKVAFLGSKLFLDLKAPSEALGFKILEKLDNLPDENKIKNYVEKFGANRVFLVFDKIKAYDPYSARKEAIKGIEKISSLFAFFHHKSGIKWRKESIVWNDDIQKIISKPINQILNCKDLRPLKASKQLNDTIKRFGLERDSFRRVDKSIDFHETAITSGSIENQFVNLFTAFEILIPKDIEANKDRISQISTSLQPFISFDYNFKIFSHLTKCIKDWDYSYFRNILEKITEGDNYLVKICAFISLTKYDNLREELLAKLHDEKYTLLKNRVFKLNKIYSSPKELLKHLSIHEKRILWHIDRIYRTRNLIIHSGEVPSYTETVIENLHSYYDILINDIFKMVINGQNIKTLEQAYIEKSLIWNDYINFIESKVKVEVNETNFLQLLLPK